MKKKVKVSLISIGVICLIIVGIMTINILTKDNKVKLDSNNTTTTQVQEKQTESTNNLEEVTSTEEVEQESNETTKAVESTNKITTIGSKTNTTVKSNTNKTSTSKSTKSTTTATFKTTQFITQTKTVKPKTTTTMQVQEKHICTMNDEKWATKVKWINKQNESVFNSLEEALDYGNYAMNIGYAYWYNPQAYHYENDTCEKDYYTVEVYIPKRACKLPDGTENPNIYLPATPRNKLIGAVDYLVSLGYECPGKVDLLSGNKY